MNFQQYYEAITPNYYGEYRGVSYPKQFVATPLPFHVNTVMIFLYREELRGCHFTKHHTFYLSLGEMIEKYGNLSRSEIKIALRVTTKR